MPKTDQEEFLREMGFEVVCGVDEVGRGAWAGPLIAAAVIMPQNVKAQIKNDKWEKEIRDSKMLSAKERERLNLLIRKHCRCGIGEVSVKELEKHKMTRGTQLAFRRAIEDLGIKVDFVLSDCFKFDSPIPSRGIIKGDVKCMSIAAASIVAKVYRDKLMENTDRQYPGYCFKIHKGYGTKLHQNALKRLGKCAEHRSFFEINKIT